MIDMLIAFGGGVVVGVVATIGVFAAILKYIDKLIQQDEDLRNE